MCKKLCIIVDSQLVHERQRKKSSLEFRITILLERVLEVINVCTDSVPADTLDVFDFVGIA